MATHTLSLTWRTRLARLALLVVIAAIIATSDTDWQVYDEASLPLPASIPPGGLTARAIVMYQAPRGAWPLSVSHRLSSYGPATSRFGQPLYDEAEVKVAGGAGQFEVRCTQKLCTGMIVVDVRLTHSLAQGGPIRSALDDGGMSPPSLRVSAGVYASPSRGFFGCQRQESSTDQRSPPRQLMFDVTLEDFEESGDDRPVDAGVSTGSSALPALQGLDAGRE